MDHIKHKNGKPTHGTAKTFTAKTGLHSDPPPTHESSPSMDFGVLGVSGFRVYGFRGLGFRGLGFGVYEMWVKV